MSTEANRFGGIWRFLLACWKANIASALEYRLSFFLLAGMMLLNNLIWVFFWHLFFSRFPVVQGWELRDVMMLWALSAGGFGWASVLFGNYGRIANIVSSGQLDVYLSQPKPVLLHVLASRMSVAAAGDFLFGWLIYAWVGDHTIRGFLLFVAGLLLTGLLFMGLMIVVGCISFWYGNSEGIAGQVFNSFITLTTYPSDIFRGVARTLLFTVIPAGFISYLPIGLIRSIDPAFLIAAVSVTFGLMAAGYALFALGLRRYASGNAITVRQ